ncbi:MAG: ELM1/GtrOC1 family putative glycosyltransferase [Candidatus Kaelpia imicola]|nr:ELM1/GtrOC1 family putative glycosyltransferase [Candidatus Kaelpia imicola]
MKKRFLEDWIFYWIALAVKGFFSLFPYRLGVGFGAGVIYLLSFFYSRRFDVAYMNLKSAFPCKYPAEIKWLIRRSILNLGLSFMEFILSVKLNKERLSSLADFKGRENLNKELGSGKGIIFLTAHYNNWEILPFLSAVLGCNCHVIAREQKYVRLNMLLNRYRSRWGSVVVEKGFSLKAIFRALRKAEVIGILADQSAGKKGIQVKLLDRYASTNPGFISIARSTGAVVIPVFLRRKSLFRHDMDIYPSMDLNKPGREILSDYNRILESYIRRNPEQWLWFHKKWKYSLNKKILILSDSKPGHFKQSRMVAEELKKTLERRNALEWNADDPGLVSISEVVVNWKNRFSKNILHVLGVFASSKAQGRLAFLKFFIAPDSYRALIKDKYDYIISAGSSMVVLNLLLNIENRAFNIHILNPGIYKNRFRLSLVPEHDGIEGENVFSYKGALAEKREVEIDSAEKYLEGLDLDQNALKISVLIGGNPKSSKSYAGGVKELFSRLDSLSKEREVNLLVTTSRRTSQELELFLKNSLSSKNYLKALVIANEYNPSGAYNAILDSAEIVFVGADSISMVSEALAFAKNVAVFKAGKIKSKNERLIQSLKREGFLSVLEPQNLGCFDMGSLEDRKVKVLDNRAMIADLLERVL